MTKMFEKSEEADKDKEGNESATPDTTSQHKNHLFDLNCKICIGNFQKHIYLNASCTKAKRKILVMSVCAIIDLQ